MKPCPHPKKHQDVFLQWHNDDTIKWCGVCGALWCRPWLKNRDDGIAKRGRWVLPADAIHLNG